MHTNRISPARKILVWLAALVGLTLLAGCDTVTLTNLTPASMPENPSQIYVFSVRIVPRTNTVPPASIAPHIIIDGRSFDLKRSPSGENIYDFEYQLPAGREEVAYYFLVNYSIEGNGVLHPAESYTEVSKAKITRRSVVPLEVNRGPVGARISVLGRGFTPNDKISFNGTPAQTFFESATSLSFFVPSLEANKNYQVTVTTGSGVSPVGTFRIDPSIVTVSPTSLTLRSGARQSLTFTVQNPAPAGGMLLDITTDVPESVIMPEVVVPQGATSATVNVEGGKPGNGNLFLKGYSPGEVTIPITVTAK